jgi:hypothetical protein
MTRTIPTLVFTLALGVFSASFAQDARRGALVMYVGPAPLYLMSVGLAVPERDRLVIRARIEFSADCTPAGVLAVDVTEERVFPMREINPGETPEAYGELHASAYREGVTARGGTPTLEYSSCVQQVMTQRALRQLERR